MRLNASMRPPKQQRNRSPDERLVECLTPFHTQNGSSGDRGFNPAQFSHNARGQLTLTPDVIRAPGTGNSVIPFRC